jgi:ribonuclease P protein component
MQAIKQKMKNLDRLRKRSDFLRVKNAGKSWVSKSLILQIAENIGSERRFGITASKRTSPRAVDRNRIKRRLRAVIYEILPDAVSGMDYVLIGRSATLTHSYEDLKKDLSWCLRKLGCLT